MLEKDEYKDFDVNAAVSGIASDLFGAGEGEDPPASTELESQPAVEALPAETPSAEAPAPNPETPAASPEPDIPLPKSWKKEMAADWATLPKTVQDHIVKRETEAYNGIRQYHQGHQSYSALTEPFKEIFSQHPDVQPVQLFQNLMHSHVKLLTLPPDQKRQFAKELLSAYGISPEGAEGAPQSGSLPPEFLRMQQELAETRRYIRENQERAHQAEVARYEAEVQAFAKDPKNPHFPQVQDDILRLISTGAASDLKTAYETAIWANPAVRAKLLAEQQAEALAAAEKARKKTPLNIESSGTSRARNGKPASLDDTIDSVVNKHFAKH